MLVNRETGQIYMYGVVGDEDFWGDGAEAITDTVMIRALDQIDGKRAKLHINSPGGFVDQGVAIYNTLKNYSPGVDVYIDALCASIASVIALAGETRTSFKGSRWMIHRAMMFAAGNTNDLQQAIDQLSNGDKAILEIYSDHMSVDVSEIEAKMDAETWFTSSEAVEIGLATTQGSDEVSQSPIAANWFRNAPDALYKQAAVAGNDVVKPKFPVARQTAAIKSGMRV